MQINRVKTQTCPSTQLSIYNDTKNTRFQGSNTVNKTALHKQLLVSLKSKLNLYIYIYIYHTAMITCIVTDKINSIKSVQTQAFKLRFDRKNGKLKEKKWQKPKLGGAI